MRQGWEYKKLGDLCDIYQPKTLATEQLVADGKYYVYGANGIIGRYNDYNHEQSEILLTCRGATCGTINISQPYSWINGNAMVIHRKSEDLSFDFLKYLMLSLDYSLIITGAAQPQITRQKIAPIIVKFPSLSVQQSIVSELDKINELIRLKKEQLKDYDNLAQSIFYEMFGDPVMNEKGWEVKKLGEVCTYPNKRISLSDITSYEYVGVETLVKNKGGVLFTEELPNAKNAIEYIENDILIGNIRPYLKKIWKSDRHGGASGDVVIIRISDSMKGLLTPVYLFKLLSTDEFFEYDNANTHGAKMPRGDRKAIGEFTIQIPPMHLQHIFAQRIELIEQQKAEIKSTIADLETLLASRMQYWFDL